MNILELANQTGIRPRLVASTAGGEYHSACPACGGKDRFFIQPHRRMSKCFGSYSCRQCGVYGDAIQFAREFLNFSYSEAVQEVEAHAHHIITPLVPKSSSRQLISPPNLWKTKVTAYVNRANMRLSYKKEVLAMLQLRGLPLKAINRYKIGWSDKNNHVSRSEWGLNDVMTEKGKVSSLWLPCGIVIPTIDANGDVIRLKIRRQFWKPNDTMGKYIAISGSMNGLNIVGDKKHSNMFVVESELDAYALEHIISDFGFVIAVGSCMKHPDNVTDRLAKNAHRLLICHDNDNAGKNMLAKWQRLYPHAKAYPVPNGKDIGEAIQLGIDIKNWAQKGVL